MRRTLVSRKDIKNQDPAAALAALNKSVYETKQIRNPNDPTTISPTPLTAPPVESNHITNLGNNNDIVAVPSAVSVTTTPPPTLVQSSLTLQTLTVSVDEYPSQSPLLTPLSSEVVDANGNVFVLNSPMGGGVPLQEPPSPTSSSLRARRLQMMASRQVAISASPSPSSPQISSSNQPFQQQPQLSPQQQQQQQQSSSSSFKPLGRLPECDDDGETPTHSTHHQSVQFSLPPQVQTGRVYSQDDETVRLRSSSRSTVINYHHQSNNNNNNNSTNTNFSISTSSQSSSYDVNSRPVSAHSTAVTAPVQQQQQYHQQYQHPQQQYQQYQQYQQPQPQQQYRVYPLSPQQFKQLSPQHQLQQLKHLFLSLPIPQQQLLSQLDPLQQHHQLIQYQHHEYTKVQERLEKELEQQRRQKEKDESERKLKKELEQFSRLLPSGQRKLFQLLPPHKQLEQFQQYQQLEETRRKEQNQKFSGLRECYSSLPQLLQNHLKQLKPDRQLETLYKLEKLHQEEKQKQEEDKRKAEEERQKREEESRMIEEEERFLQQIYDSLPRSQQQLLQILDRRQQIIQLKQYHQEEQRRAKKQHKQPQRQLHHSVDDSSVNKRPPQQNHLPSQDNNGDYNGNQGGYHGNDNSTANNNVNNGNTTAPPPPPPPPPSPSQAAFLRLQASVESRQRFLDSSTGVVNMVQNSPMYHQHHQRNNPFNHLYNNQKNGSYKQYPTPPRKVIPQRGKFWKSSLQQSEKSSRLPKRKQVLLLLLSKQLKLRRQLKRLSLQQIKWLKRLPPQKKRQLRQLMILSPKQLLLLQSYQKRKLQKRKSMVIYDISSNVNDNRIDFINKTNRLRNKIRPRPRCRNAIHARSNRRVKNPGLFNCFSLRRPTNNSRLGETDELSDDEYYPEEEEKDQNNNNHNNKNEQDGNIENYLLLQNNDGQKSTILDEMISPETILITPDVNHDFYDCNPFEADYYQPQLFTPITWIRSVKRSSTRFQSYPDDYYGKNKNPLLPERIPYPKIFILDNIFPSSYLGAETDVLIHSDEHDVLVLNTLNNAKYTHLSKFLKQLSTIKRANGLSTCFNSCRCTDPDGTPNLAGFYHHSIPQFCSTIANQFRLASFDKIGFPDYIDSYTSTSTFQNRPGNNKQQRGKRIKYGKQSLQFLYNPRRYLWVPSFDKYGRYLRTAVDLDRRDSYLYEFCQKVVHWQQCTTCELLINPTTHNVTPIQAALYNIIDNISPGADEIVQFREMMLNQQNVKELTEFYRQLITQTDCTNTPITHPIIDQTLIAKAHQIFNWNGTYEDNLPVAPHESCNVLIFPNNKPFSVRMDESFDSDEENYNDGYDGNDGNGFNDDNDRDDRDDRDDDSSDDYSDDSNKGLQNDNDNDSGNDNIQNENFSKDFILQKLKTQSSRRKRLTIIRSFLHQLKKPLPPKRLPICQIPPQLDSKPFVFFARSPTISTTTSPQYEENNTIPDYDCRFDHTTQQYRQIPSLVPDQERFTLFTYDPTVPLEIARDHLYTKRSLSTTQCQKCHFFASSRRVKPQHHFHRLRWSKNISTIALIPRNLLSWPRYFNNKFNTLPYNVLARIWQYQDWEKKYPLHKGKMCSQILKTDLISAHNHVKQTSVKSPELRFNHINSQLNLCEELKYVHAESFMYFISWSQTDQGNWIQVCDSDLDEEDDDDDDDDDDHDHDYDGCDNNDYSHGSNHDDSDSDDSDHNHHHHDEEFANQYEIDDYNDELDNYEYEQEMIANDDFFEAIQDEFDQEGRNLHYNEQRLVELSRGDCYNEKTSETGNFVESTVNDINTNRSVLFYNNE